MVKSIYEQLRQNSSSLARTVRRAQLLQHLNTLLAEPLDATLAAHCRLANIRANTAVLQAESPVWAARLRYQTPAILQWLNTTDLIAELTNTRLTHVHLRVQPIYHHYQRPAPSRPQLSSRSAELLQNVANTMSDPHLKRLLIQLSRRSRGTE